MADVRSKWWRRRELNPRPKMLLVKRLHAYSRSCPGITRDVRGCCSERTRNTSR